MSKKKSLNLQDSQGPLGPQGTWGYSRGLWPWQTDRKGQFYRIQEAPLAPQGSGEPKKLLAVPSTFHPFCQKKQMNIEFFKNVRRILTRKERMGSWFTKGQFI